MNKYKKMQLIKFVPWVSVALVIVVLISFRAHYSIDIPVGILVGIEAGIYAVVIDKKADRFLKRVFCRRKWLERIREWEQEQSAKDLKDPKQGSVLGNEF